MMKLIVTKPGTLKAADKSALRKAGIVCVEAENPSDVRMIDVDFVEISASGMLLAAMRAIVKDRYTDNVAQKFPALLLAALEAERQPNGTTHA